jgi:predicted DNA-binding transcriptional regulator YafY
MDHPKDMTPSQRAVRLLELLERGRRLSVRDAARRLGVQRHSVYRIVNSLSVVRPDLRIESGEIFEEEI